PSDSRGGPSSFDGAARGVAQNPRQSRDLLVSPQWHAVCLSDGRHCRGDPCSRRRKEVRPMFAKICAESLGTFWLVLGGCGSAVLAAAFPDGIGLLGVSLAFGLTVLSGAYALGP